MLTATLPTSAAFDPTMLLLVHAASTWFLVGLTWFVGMVHYPLFARVGREGYSAYQASHVARTTWVVVPPMTVELGTALLLLAEPPPGVPTFELWLGMAAVALVWLSTFALAVPAHGALAHGFAPKAHRRLLLGHGLRTVLWTARGLLVARWLLVSV